ncbi:M16 family metallopeptidase [Flexithrix dorotheae]|uniref:M16 family metallopeptidase n=1 Tax=Flexithrix dorotheae TaxID=70993 RepID=UPI000374D73C|nr:pitrilysin family protein [Flexithrix dorotheae]
MIDFHEFSLDNGLQVIVHQDKTVPIAVLDLLYNVGSKDENPEKTGFAHLFEHLMFGGSKNIPNYDSPLQKVGGDNNAFTSPDITNYYVTVPANNLETAFWLESDRMLELSFDPEVLSVQKKVVIEEFKQRYLNQPYGDVWLKLRPLAYKIHPYQWPTIGKEISHIENATMEDVKDFFYTHYRPNNAILTIAGNVKLKEVERLTKKWFGNIPSGKPYRRNLPEEPIQTTSRIARHQADVPVNTIYKTYHMCEKNDINYIPTDLLSDILGRGKSSRLYQSLVKEKKIFNGVNASISGSIEKGLFIISGKIKEGISYENADLEIQREISKLKEESINDDEVTKVKNQAESTLSFSELELLPRALNLAYSKLLGDTNLVNKTSEKIQAVTSKDILRNAEKVLIQENCTTLYYGK